MHPRFIEALCCPETREPLALEATERAPDGAVAAGALVSPSGRRYPIVRGVPRFVGEERYAASFGYEWNRWPRVQFESENAGRPMAGHTTRMWEAITEAPAAAVSGKTIVEFGCGSGRFLDVVRRKGGRAVGIDLSTAVDAARRNFAGDPDVLVVQGDLERPPFREGAFDAGFSIGVLHHTPAPAHGLAALARAIRPGGWVACCVYPKGEFYDFPSVRRARALHRRVGRLLGRRPALLYAMLAAYFLAPVASRLRRLRGAGRALDYVQRNWLAWVELPDRRWRLLDVFDALTPEIATTHTRDDVARWFEAAGCAGVRVTPWCRTSAVGFRS